MKCQKCGKYEATTHITEIVNGVKNERCLCSKCAGLDGVNLGFGASFSPDLDNFFGSLWSTPKPLVMPKEAMCPNCKTGLSDLQKTGRLGCSECYKTFYDILLSPLKDIHGSNRHIGKIPQRASKIAIRGKQTEHLKVELNQAVLDQNFEKAAELRDKIRDLENKGQEA